MSIFISTEKSAARRRADAAYQTRNDDTPEKWTVIGPGLRAIEGRPGCAVELAESAAKALAKAKAGGSVAVPLSKLAATLRALRDDAEAQRRPMRYRWPTPGFGRRYASPTSVGFDMGTIDWRFALLTAGLSLGIFIGTFAGLVTP